MPEENEKRYPVKKELIQKYLDGIDIVQEIKIPEFKSAVLGKTEIPIFKVKRASLDDQIQARELSSKPIQVLASILERLKVGQEINLDDIDLEINRTDGLHQKTIMEITLFEKCVLDPKFTREEVLELSQAFPSLVNRIVSWALMGEILDVD